MSFPRLAGGYAVVGAASFTAGVTQTISIAVIVFELTSQLSYALPVLIGSLLARGISSLFTPGIFNAISKRLNLPGDQTPLMVNKLTELGWPNPLNNNDSRTFIEGTDMNPNQCFTDSSNTRIVDNCYINKVCQSPTGKLVDYHCNQELPYNSNDF